MKESKLIMKRRKSIVVGTTSSNNFHLSRCQRWRFRLLLLVVAVVVVIIPGWEDGTGSTAVAAAAVENNHHCKIVGFDHEDFVPHLPGLNQPLTSYWFSGYLHYELEGRTLHTHYVFVQAEEDYHDDKPLIYWSNGGPGASSLFGLLTELGPYLFSDASLQTTDYAETNIPTPIYNPYSWNRLGSILIFDQPPPIGFSYCNNSTYSHSCDGLVWNDELTSLAAYQALQAFYNKFPCYKNRDLYLTGESYAGIYIPTLARRIYSDMNVTGIPLQGFAVGDGCLGTETGICGNINDPNFVDLWYVFFMAGHGQIPLQTYHEFIQACHSSTSSSSMENPYHDGFDSFWTANNPECDAMLQKVRDQLGFVYDYSLYDECTYRNGMAMMNTDVTATTRGALNDFPCGGDVVMEQYLNLTKVQEALHVPGNYFSVDNAGGDFDYVPTEKDLTSFYQDINGHLRVLIYNGDTDPAITSFAAQNWTSSLGFVEQEAWRPWTVDGCRRMGGHVVRYGGGFDFLTIRGAGHMVPTYKAAGSFTFIQAFIKGLDYPPYHKDCKQPTPLLDQPLSDEPLAESKR